MRPDFRGSDFEGLTRAGGDCVRDCGEKTPRRLFLAVLFCTHAMGFGLFCLVLWLIQPRLTAIHPFAPHGLLVLACVALVGFGVAYASVCVSLWFNRPLRLAEAALRWFVRSLPLVMVVAPWLGIPPEGVRRSLRAIEYDFWCLRARSGCSGRIVCVAPSNLPAPALDQVRSVAAEYDSDFLQVGNAVEARQLILQIRPVAVVAVCCPPDMVRRIRELQYRISVVTVGQRADACAVCGAAPDIHQMMSVLESLRAQVEGADLTPEALSVRQRP